MKTPQNAFNRFSFVAASGNAKTGPIPVTMTDKNSCPSNCGLLGSGCYANLGMVGMHWRRLDNAGLTLQALAEKIRSIPRGQLWRHNVAGDIPQQSSGVICADTLQTLTEANKGRKGFTYTHNRVLGSDTLATENQKLIKQANIRGFTVNLSADTLAEADAMMRLNIGPVVTLLPDDATDKVSYTPAGNAIVICPAVSVDGMTCAQCKLCANPNRKSIVGFPAHGVAKKKANKVFYMKAA